MEIEAQGLDCGFVKKNEKSDGAQFLGRWWCHLLRHGKLGEYSWNISPSSDLCVLPGNFFVVVVKHNAVIGIVSSL